MTLQPTQQGPALNYFIYPYVEVDGKPFDDVALRFRFNDVAQSAKVVSESNP